MPSHHTSLVVIIAAVLGLAACGGGAETASPTATPTAPSTASPTASPGTAAPTTTDRGASPSPGDGDAGDGFGCELPVVDAGTAPIANIVDVRLGTHHGYDRIVFEFAQGTPEFSLDRAEPPFTEDGSGRPLSVGGDSHLELVMRGGTKQTDDGTSSYDGPTEFATGLPTLVHAVEAGDFERQSTWILGLAEEACVRVLLLDAPPRLVIDVEH